MSADSPGPAPIKRWTWLRWVAAIAVVFVAHVVLIFIFGARKPVAPVPVRRAPSLSLVDESPGDWLALNDATLFALPGNNGFAASMWAELPLVDLRFRPDMTEQPHWLSPSNSLEVAGLFAPFNRFIQTNHFASVHFEFNVPPEVAAPVVPTQPPIAQQSTLRIEGALAGRPLLNPTNLPSWQDADIDAPSVVQVLVNAAGDVVSAVLLPQEIISQANSWEPPLVHNTRADNWAVELARSLRFAPLPSTEPADSDTLARMAIGQLVFDWQTLPQSSTNVANPQF